MTTSVRARFEANWDVWALLVLFPLSRVGFHLLGLRFNADIQWMFLSDPAALRERLLETLYYFHAFPPGMNLITGLLLKASEDNFAVLAALLYGGFGLLLVQSMLFLVENRRMEKDLHKIAKKLVRV